MRAKKSFFIIAHNIRSLYNVGSIFRTADAFRIDKIFLTGYTGTPKNFKLAKTALGAEKTVTWEYHTRLPDLIKKLRREKIKVVALENNMLLTPPTPSSPSSPNPSFGRRGIGVAGGENKIFGKKAELLKFKPEFPLALLLGEEVGGIKNKYLRLCDAIVEIPMYGKKSP